MSAATDGGAGGAVGTGEGVGLAVGATVTVLLTAGAGSVGPGVVRPTRSDGPPHAVAAETVNMHNPTASAPRIWLVNA